MIELSVLLGGELSLGVVKVVKGVNMMMGGFIVKGEVMCEVVRVLGKVVLGFGVFGV